jgi:hypothetical protein
MYSFYNELSIKTKKISFENQIQINKELKKLVIKNAELDFNQATELCKFHQFHQSELNNTIRLKKWNIINNLAYEEFLIGMIRVHRKYHNKKVKHIYSEIYKNHNIIKKIKEF